MIRVAALVAVVLCIDDKRRGPDGTTPLADPRVSYQYSQVVGPYNASASLGNLASVQQSVGHVESVGQRASQNASQQMAMVYQQQPAGQAAGQVAWQPAAEYSVQRATAEPVTAQLPTQPASTLPAMQLPVHTAARVQLPFPVSYPFPVQPPAPEQPAAVQPPAAAEQPPAAIKPP